MSGFFNVFRNKSCERTVADADSGRRRVAGLQFCGLSVTVAEPATNSVPVNWVVRTASYEISVTAATYFAAPADARSAERYATPCGLPRGLDHIADARLPRSSMRVRCGAASKLN